MLRSGFVLASLTTRRSSGISGQTRRAILGVCCGDQNRSHFVSKCEEVAVLHLMVFRLVQIQAMGHGTSRKRAERLSGEFSGNR